MAKELVFGGKLKKEMLQDWVKGLDELRKKEKDKAPRPLQVKCPKCEHAFKHELAVLPDREIPSLEMLCEEVVNWILRPIYHYKSDMLGMPALRRDTLETVQIFAIVDAVRKLNDPKVASVVLENADHDFLKKCWEVYGKEGQQQYECVQQNQMGQKTVIKLGWGHIGTLNMPHWKRAYDMVMFSSDKKV